MNIDSALYATFLSRMDSRIEDRWFVTSILTGRKSAGLHQNERNGQFKKMKMILNCRSDVGDDVEDVLKLH